VTIARLLALLCLAVFLPGCASPGPRDPANGGWYAEGSRVVLVEGHGSTEDAAKQAALSAAVGTGTGTLVLNDVAVQGDRVVRNETSTHRSGYVVASEVVESVQLPDGGHRVRLWAKVVGSRLKLRAVPAETASQAINGAEAMTRVRAYLDYKAEGDRLLEIALQAYPLNAFQVTVEESRVTVDEHRQPMLHVRTRVQWRPLYIEAIRDAAAHVAASTSDCGVFLSARLYREDIWHPPPPRDQTGKPRVMAGACGEFADLLIEARAGENASRRIFGYALGDPVRLGTLNRKLGSPLSVEIAFEGSDGTARHRSCESFPIQSLTTFRNSVATSDQHRFGSQQRPFIHSSRNWWINWPFSISNVERLGRVERITARVVTACETPDGGAGRSRQHRRSSGGATETMPIWRG
jgi:hypothetical protein